MDDKINIKISPKRKRELLEQAHNKNMLLGEYLYHIVNILKVDKKN